METFTVWQWLALFFLYCVAGWIWESSFVSIRTRKWTNRGFLHGPVIPIYGFGALLILLLTQPVSENLALVFLVGMAGATALEFVTGWAMESLFHVRYWDYSNNPLNLCGYICLRCSLCWGAFSVLLVRFLHPPLARLVVRCPEAWLPPVVIVLSALFLADVALSTREALDLRQFLQSKLAHDERLAALRAKVRALEENIAQARATVSQRQQEEYRRAVERLRSLNERFREQTAARRRRALRILKRNPGTTARRFGPRFEDIRRHFE